MPPPRVPAFGDRFDPRATAETLGVELPSDYLAFVNPYGAGNVDDFLLVLMPGSENRYVDLCRQAAAQGAVLKQLVAQDLPRTCLPFPSPGGLLPWAITDNGDVCFWRTGDPDPDRWSVVVCDGKMLEWEAFDGGMAQFLHAVLSRQYRCPIFPDDFPSDAPAFTGFPEPAQPLT